MKVDCKVVLLSPVVRLFASRHLLGSLPLLRFFRLPFLKFLCYFLFALLTENFELKEPPPWNGSPRNTKKSI